MSNALLPIRLEESTGVKTPKSKGGNYLATDGRRQVARGNGGEGKRSRTADFGLRYAYRRVRFQGICFQLRCRSQPSSLGQRGNARGIAILDGNTLQLVKQNLILLDEIKEEMKSNEDG
ncbi:hypothetical protein HPP92_021679 [Vanilla planifolia]|uniref:Uncharacterized protein n=1 Tax=Vanilla planifolia TaxID=51239 RepID=A0A835Q4R6_VANPL|nr:hypothetical protein HPP92_021679 [Vanilla planifolia]